MYDEYLVAGSIASRVVKIAKKNIHAGMLVSDLIYFIESKIKEFGGSIAFPCCVSINSVASHYTSGLNDNTILLPGDLVKIDLGVHVNGYIADTAFSSIVMGDNPEIIPENMPGRNDNENLESTLDKKCQLIDTTSLALENAISIIREGVTLSSIGSTIEETAREKSLYPIPNIMGHSIDRFNLHSGIKIPSYNNNSDYKLEEGDCIAVEPYLSYSGRDAVAGKSGNIFYYLRRRPFSDDYTCKLLDKISSRYSRLPFTERHLENYQTNEFKRSFNLLVSARALYPVPMLLQPDALPVCQFEHTIIVEKRGCIVTTRVKEEKK